MNNNMEDEKRAFTMIDLVNILLGNINVIGESNYDEKAYANLDKWKALTDYMLMTFISLIPYKNRSEYSMKIQGEKAENIIKEYNSYTDVSEIIATLKAQIERKDALINNAIAELRYENIGTVQSATQTLMKALKETSEELK